MHLRFPLRRTEQAPVVPSRYGIGPVESIGGALQRVCMERLGYAVDVLSDPLVERNEGIHEARKALKRVRAMIRLVRDTVGNRAYRRENVVLRDTARLLAPARDCHVLVATLDGVVESYRGQLAAGAFAALRRRLVARHQETFATVADGSQIVTDVIAALQCSRRRFAGWNAEAAVPDCFDSIALGLRRVYARGHRAHAAACREPSTRICHEWRKRVKYLRYQLETLVSLWPAVIDATAASLDGLAEMLGDEHDLARLEEVAGSEPAPVGEATERRLLRAILAQERGERWAAAQELGSRLYAEIPEDFVRRVGAYWTASGRR
jgi:CHAD domain-containing protein